MNWYDCGMSGGDAMPNWVVKVQRRLGNRQGYYRIFVLFCQEGKWGFFMVRVQTLHEASEAPAGLGGAKSIPFPNQAAP